ncbi:MAG: chorismate-binding protein [Alphaproteobacteria bacterium]
MFLTLGANGMLTSRPIKGSAPRGVTAKEDEKLRDALLASEKNAAENLMIVDLMRNDLARVSEPGSVAVAERSALHSYATIHHLVSTVTRAQARGCGRPGRRPRLFSARLDDRRAEDRRRTLVRSTGKNGTRRL